MGRSKKTSAQKVATKAAEEPANNNEDIRFLLDLLIEGRVCAVIEELVNAANAGFIAFDAVASDQLEKIQFVSKILEDKKERTPKEQLVLRRMADIMSGFINGTMSLNASHLEIDGYAMIAQMKPDMIGDWKEEQAKFGG